MTPQQLHYQSIAWKNGWWDKKGRMMWPTSETERRAMARRILGLELVCEVDGMIEASEDVIYDTTNAQHAVTRNDPRLRAIFRTMSNEQRDACLELVQEQARLQLFGFCVLLDQFKCGALSLHLAGTNTKQPEETIQIQPGDFLDLHEEQEIWFGEFSRVFGAESPEET